MQIKRACAIVALTMALVVGFGPLTPGTEPTGYKGDTVLTASAITPVITLRRNTSVIPAVVQATASATTGTGITYPWEDVEYQWDFGDPSGVEIFTHPFYGGTVNANDDQFGPEAAYIYRAIGTYTITLTCRVWNGSAMIRGSTTATFTATDDSGLTTFYCDSNAGGTNSGTLANPYNTTANVITALTGGNSRKILIKRGSVFNFTSQAQFNNTRTVVRVTDYGSGALPILRETAAIARMINYTTSSVRCADHVWTNIAFDGGGLATTATVGGASSAGGDVDDLCFNGCTWVGAGELKPSVGITSSNSNATVNNDGFVFWNCAFDGSASGSSSGANQSLTSSGGFTSASTNLSGQYYSVVGCSFVGGSRYSGSALDHHLYPRDWDHALFRWIDFNNGGRQNMCINGSAHDLSGGTGQLSICNYWLVADCDFQGTKSGVDFSENNNNDTVGHFSHCMVERCSFHGLGYGPQKTDLVIDGVSNTKVTSATHVFAAADVNENLTIVSGTGFTVGTYNVNSVSAGVATLSAAVGTVGSTGGTFILGGGGGQATAPNNCFQLEFRDNWIWGQTFTPTPKNDYIANQRTNTANVARRTDIYRNKIEFADNGSTKGVLLTNPANAGIFDTGQFRDNTIEDLRSASTIFRIPYLTTPTNTMTFSNNAIYTPNDSDPDTQDMTTTSAGTTRTMAVFEQTYGAQATDITNGVASIWSNPSSGVFELATLALESRYGDSQYVDGSSAYAEGQPYALSSSQTLYWRIYNGGTTTLTLTSGGLTIGGSLTVGTNPVSGGAVTLLPLEYTTATATPDTATNGTKTGSFAMTSNEAGSPFNETFIWGVGTGNSLLKKHRNRYRKIFK